MSKRIDLLKELHMCTVCGAVDDRTLSGRSLCKKCSEKGRAYQKAFCEKRKKKKVCIACGIPDERTLAGKSHCAFCANKLKRYKSYYNSEQAMSKYYRRKEAGLCTMCGRPRNNETLLCNACRDKNRKNSKAYCKRLKVDVEVGSVNV